MTGHDTGREEAERAARSRYEQRKAAGKKPTRRKRETEHDAASRLGAIAHEHDLKINRPELSRVSAKVKDGVSDARASVSKVQSTASKAQSSARSAAARAQSTVRSVADKVPRASKEGEGASQGDTVKPPRISRAGKGMSRGMIAGVCAVVLVAVIGVAAFATAGSHSMQTSSDATDAAVETSVDAEGTSDASDASATEGSDDASSSGEEASSSETQPDPNDTRAASFAVGASDAPWNYGSNGEKVVYLTIDDGPSANTQKVLDILDQYDAKATFFVSGQDPDYFYMIKVAYDKGHTIGLHSYSHDYSVIYSSEEAYFQDLDAIGQVVKDQIGYVPAFIRFPGGSSNTICNDYCEGIMDSLTQDVTARGYMYYDWNATVGDGSNISADETVAAACDPSYLEYDNIMMLMHDAGAKENTVEALPRIIEYYQEHGYTFKAIDRESIVVQHR